MSYGAPLSMGLPRKEYWSGLPFPPPGDLPNPETEPMSLASPALAGRFFTTNFPGGSDGKEFAGDPLEKGMATHSSILA